MIICAAVRFKILEINSEVTLCSIRHHYCYEQMRDLGFKYNEFDEIGEGFIDHKGNFLTREEAWKHAIECGQIGWTTREKSDSSGRLFSEDLW